jgi:hypothetical protein
MAQRLELSRKQIQMSLTFILSSLLFFSAGAQEAPTAENKTIILPTIKHQAFAKGEKLNYEISYGWLDAGEASIEIKRENHTIADREVYHIVGLGNSTGTFNWFFKVRDRYETYLDKNGVFPWIFVRDIHEGGFNLQQYYTFNPYEQKVVTEKKKEYKVPLGIQDMISSFYRARANDYSKAKPEDIFEFQAFVDNEIWPLKIKYLGVEQKEVNDKVFDCMVFSPVVQTGRIFKKEEDLKVWITRDKNKIPVMAEAQILVGSIKMQLTDYSGLANPIAIIED